MILIKYIYIQKIHIKQNINIKKREKADLHHYDDTKAFIEYSNDMQDVYKNTEDYYPRKKDKILIVLGDMIAGMINNKKINPIVT